MRVVGMTVKAASARRIGGVVLALSGVSLLAACSGGSGDSGDKPGDKPAANKVDDKPAPAPKITVDPADASKDVENGKIVNVTVSDGTLVKVDVAGTRSTGASGGKASGAPAGATALEGAINDNGNVWTSSGLLAPTTDYTVNAVVKDGKGKESTLSSKFSTKVADKTNKVTIVPANGQAVGVGMPISVVFDYPVKNKADVEKKLKVTSTPETEGSWGWIKDRSGKDRVDWRPKEYWKPGTKVKFEANVHGVDTGNDRFLVRDYGSEFTIGDTARVTKIDAAEKTMTVEENGQVVKTFPVALGKSGFDTWTGKMAVISKQADIRMTSASVGVTDPGEQWDLDVKWAVHMTLSGTFTHAAPWNNSLGKANNSHGCVNMSDTDAKWFYDRAVTGDPIEVKGSKPDKVVDPGNGYGAFTLTWDEWKAKSALAA